MRVYEYPNPDWFYETKGCDPPRQSHSNKSCLKKTQERLSWIRHWGDFRGKELEEVGPNDLCIGNRPKNSRKRGAMLPLSQRGIKTFKLTAGDPPGFAEKALPMSLAQVIAAGGEPDPDPPPELEPLEPEGFPEFVEEAKPQRPKSSINNSRECLRFCLFGELDPDYDGPKLQFIGNFPQKVSRIAYLNRNRDRKAKMDLANYCSCCNKLSMPKF